MKKYIGITVAMGAARQLIKGSGVDRLAWLRHNLPQKIEDGQLINYEGEVITDTNLPDQELVKLERLTEAKVITDALLTDLFHPLNTTLFVNTDKEPVEDTDEVVPDPIATLDEGEVDVDCSKLEKAIKKGKKEKAESLLADLKGDLAKDLYKTYKKQIKGL